MPNLVEWFDKLTGTDIFKGIGLPSFLIVLQLIGKYISDRKCHTRKLRHLFRILSEDLHVSLCVISVGAIFYIGHIVGKSEGDFEPDTFLLLLLIVVIIFLVSSVFAGRLLRSSTELWSRNTLIGMHIPNALGAVSIFISYILYENLGVLLS